MVAQSGGSYSFVKHHGGDVFEVTAFRDGHAATYKANPAAEFCSCGEPDCQHLWDAAYFLRDHACPACKAYSPFSVLHAACADDVATRQIAQVA